MRAEPWRGRDAAKEQSGSAGRNSGARQQRKTAAGPSLLHLRGLCYRKTSLTLSSARERDASEPPSTTAAVRSPLQAVGTLSLDHREILHSLDKNYRMKCFIQLSGGVKQGEDVDFSRNKAEILPGSSSQGPNHLRGPVPASK